MCHSSNLIASSPDRSGAPLSEIFDMFGQDTFRRAEREALDDVLRRHGNFVIATSGSIATEPGTLELLLTSCFTVWVRAEPEEYMKRVMAQGDMRPMAKVPALWRIWFRFLEAANHSTQRRMQF